MKKNVIIGCVAVFLIAVVFVVVAEMQRNSLTASGSFPVREYIENPKSFAGNAYRFSAQIDLQLAYDDSAGRILLVNNLDGSEKLPVFVPSGVKNFNPMAGQRYVFCVKISNDGSLTLTSFEKL